MTNDDYRVYYVSHKNTKIGGSVEVDEDGFASIFINPRRSHLQQLKTLDHELRHLENDDLYNDNSIEVVEARAANRELLPPRVEETPPQQRTRPAKKPRKRNPQAKEGLRISYTLKADAFAAYGIPENDPQWDEIVWAMLITGSNMPKNDPRGRQTFYSKGVCVRKGMLFRSHRMPSYMEMLMQRRQLGYPRR